VVFSNNLLAGSGGQSTGYEIDQSIRFNADDSAYLTRTPSSEGNRRTFTLSTWVKFNEIRSDNIVFASWIPSGASSYALMYMHSDFRVRFEDQGTSKIKPSMVFRDLASWYHIVLRVDTTDSIANDRYQMYINGERQTDLHENDQPSQNHQTNVNKTQPHYLGRNGYSLAMIYSDLYQAETHFLDGTAYDASFFGETDSATGQWIPKKYTGGNYGTNGFYITGEDSTFLGQDVRTSGDQVNSFQASQWTGATGSYTFTDGRIQADTDNKAIKSVDTFTGDFEFSWRYIDMANFVIGFYEIDEDSTFSDSSSAGNMQNMTDSWYVQTSSVAANRDIYYGGAVQVNATTIANGDTWKLQRSSGTIKVYRNGSAVHTFSQTSTNEVRLVVAQGDASADVGEVNWVDNATLGNNLFSSGLSTADQMLDTPTNNFCTLSPIDKFGSGLTLSDGNLRAVPAASAYGNNHGTFYINSGKWVFECKHTTVFGEACGWSPPQEYISGSSDRGYFMFVDGRAYDNTTNTGTKGASLANGDFRYVFYDADAQAMWFAHVDVSSSNALVYDNSATKAEIEAGTTTNAVFTNIPAGYWAPGIWMDTSGVIEVNFGQSAFATTSDLPSGFNTLKAANLPDPTVPLPEKYFNTVLYEGNGAGQRVGQFQPLTELYSVPNSVIFNEGDTAYLNRTPGSASNRNTFTWSFWIKRGNLTSHDNIFSAGTNSNNFTFGAFINDKIQFGDWSGSYGWNLVSNQVFSDPSIWYNVVFRYDDTQSTESNRVRIYVNGSQLTSYGTESYPSQNYGNTEVNNTVEHTIGRQTAGSGNNDYFDGYMTEINLIDGQSLGPDSFGQLDASTNKWIPKDTSGLTFGTNGFYLDMEIAPGTGNGAGNDVSGNNNDFNENNLAATDQVTDSPTNNHSTLNPKQQNATGLSQGNLQFTTSSTSTHKMASATIPVTSGKWYCEVTCNAALGSNARIGIIPEDNDNYSGSDGHVGDDANSFAYVDSGVKESNNTQSSYGASYANGDVIAMALNLDDNELTFYKNGSSQGAINITSSKKYRFAASQYNAGGMAFNFGQSSFSSTPPTGFSALTTDNLPLSSGELSGFVWIKNRDATDNNMLFDAVRGIKKDIHSNSTDQQATNANTLTRFLKNGFEISNDNEVNTSAESYVAWQWLFDSLTTSTNDDGTVDSTIIANTTAGFSIAQWTHTTSGNYTVGHGLGATPKMIWVKTLDQGTNWGVYHSDITVGNRLILNTTAAQSSGYWGANTWNSTVFSIGSARDSNGSTMIGYVFAEVEGFSSIGSFEGNSNADGSFVYTGFRPAFILTKNIDTTDQWGIRDSARNPFNVTDKLLNPNANTAETSSSTGFIDILSNGFKARSSDSNINTNTLVYIAFAELPFKTSNAR